MPENKNHLANLKTATMESVQQYAEQMVIAQNERQSKPPYPACGKTYGTEEFINGVEAVLDAFWTEGRWAETFRNELKTALGVRFVTLCNSGSSANTLSLMSASSPELGDKRLKPGDEVITSANGFATTLSPITLLGFTPVLVDCAMDTMNSSPESVEKAITEKTRAIVLAHTLGNPHDASTIKQIANDHDLIYIEDSCDALGGKLNGEPVGTFGDMASLSFYPAHIITTGEGGAVLTNSGRFDYFNRSGCNWGRHCWCKPGRDNTCHKRFEWQLGDLPEGFDHKTIARVPGLNFKMTDLTAAIGCAQIKKLPQIVETRQQNFNRLKSTLSKYGDELRFVEPLPGAEPCWFGFPITVRENLRFSKRELVDFLEENGVGTRTAVIGNLARQPAFKGVCRVSGELVNADNITENSFWIGVHPGIGENAHQHIEAVFSSFFARPRPQRK